MDIASNSQGDIYISDLSNFRIRKYNAQTDQVTTIGGTGSSAHQCTIEGLAATSAALQPTGITLSGGQVYFTDTSCGSRLLTINSSGNIHVVATGLTYMNTGIATDSSGDILVPANDGIYQVTTSGTVTTFAGYPGSNVNYGNTGDGGPATSAQFHVPSALAVDGSNIFVEDSYNYRAREIKADGNIYALQGPGSTPYVDGSAAINNYLPGPAWSIGVDSNHNVYIGGGSQNNPYIPPVRKIVAVGGAVSTTSPTYAIPNGLDGDGEANGGCNPSENCCPHHCHGDPVDTATGEYWQQKSDISIPGRGLPLNFTRSYSSIGAQEQTSAGPMGYGWSSSYGMSLTNDSVSGDITIHQENGSTVLFVPNSTGTAYTSPTRVLATLVHNGDGTWTFTRRARTIFAFDSSGTLISEKDLNGETTSFSYDGSGRLSTITDPAGRTLTLGYDSSNRIISVKDSSGREVDYGYDSSDNLTDVTDIGGGTWHYTYDSAHRLLTEEDPRSDTILTNTYDSAGRVETQVDALSRETDFAYGNGTTTVTSPAGNVTEYDYENGLLTQKTEGVGTSDAASWKYSYDPTTLGVTSVTDPNGHTTTATYDSAGNLTKVTDPLSHSTSFGYDSLDDRTTITDGNNVTTTLTYDSKGNLTGTSTPLVGSSPAKYQTWGFAHGNSSHPGDVTGITDPNSHTTALGYDTNGDLSSVTDPAGDQTTYGYDSIGRRTSMVSPLGNVTGGTPSDHTTTYSYNVFGDITKAVDPLSGETDLVYDGDRNLTSVTDPDTNKTSYVYDAANQLTEIDRADTSALKNSYDDDGNLASQTDGASNATSYAYDHLDRLSSVTDPLSRPTNYAYDGAGNLTGMTDPLSRTNTYGYDNANRLTSIKYSDGTTPNATFGYDADNQRTSMSDGTGSSTFSYDSLHRLTQTTGQGNTVGFGFDLANNETSITYGTSHTVTRAFDSANRLTSVTDWLSKVTNFGYDADSDLTSTTFPSSTTNVDNYGYDHADRLTSATMKQGSTTLASLSYTRDAMGQVTGESQTGLPGASSTSYSYTALNQLSSAGPNNYSYDSADNLTQLDGASSYGYDAANELTSIPSGAPGGSATLNYNDLGERTALTPTSGPATSYGYDQAGRLTGVGSATYAYGGDGLRATTTIGGSTQTFFWDRTGALPMLLGDGSVNYIYGPGGLPVEQISSGGTAIYYHHDQLGSTRMLTDTSGNASATYTYNPYGALAGSTGSQTAALGYAGQYTDSESGLQYLRGRYYDSVTGQFISRDPLTPISQSPYGYAFDNPLNGGDPSGLLFGISFPSARDIATTYVGAVDGATGGLTADARNLLGIGSGGLNTCSELYKLSQIGGVGILAFFLPEAGAAAYAAIADRSLELAALYPRASTWIAENSDILHEYSSVVENYVKWILGIK